MGMLGETSGGGAGGGGISTLAALAILEGGENAVTAFATGGQTSATALSSTVLNHRVSICATAGDSVKLPAATVGQQHYIRNDGVASCQVYGQATETINAVASATGVALGTGMGVWYICTLAGTWTTSPTSVLRMGDGTGALPSYSFASNNAYGMYYDNGRGHIAFGANTATPIGIASTGMRIGSTRTIAWLNTDPSAGTTADAVISRLAAGSLGMTTGRWSGLQGATVASANDITLGSDGNRFQISGTTTVNRILNTGWQGGSIITLHFQGSLTVAHNVASGSSFQSLMLSGAVNFSATANDQLTLQYDSTDAKWYEIARTVI